MRLNIDKALVLLDKGYSVKEISRILDVSPSSIYTGLSRLGRSCKPTHSKQEQVYAHAQDHGYFNTSLHFGISLDAVYAHCSRERKKLLTACSGMVASLNNKESI